MSRSSGILLHPTSFPSRFGIGDLGPEAYKFIDFLVEAGQTLWQVLPLGPTGYGDSPYASYSAFAGNTLLISPERLVDEGLLDHGDLEETPVGPIDYGNAHQLKDKILASAYQNFVQTENATFQSEFEAFVRQQSYWLDDYALFRALKDERGGAAWTEWDNDSGSRERLKSKTEAHPTCRSLPKISALFPRAAFGGRVAARGQLRRCRTFWVWRSNPLSR